MTALGWSAFALPAATALALALLPGAGAGFARYWALGAILAALGLLGCEALQNSWALVAPSVVGLCALMTGLGSLTAPASRWERARNLSTLAERESARAALRQPDADVNFAAAPLVTLSAAALWLPLCRAEDWRSILLWQAVVSLLLFVGGARGSRAGWLAALGLWLEALLFLLLTTATSASGDDLRHVLLVGVACARLAVASDLGGTMTGALFALPIFMALPAIANNPFAVWLAPLGLSFAVLALWLPRDLAERAWLAGFATLAFHVGPAAGTGLLLLLAGAVAAAWRASAATKQADFWLAGALMAAPVLQLAFAIVGSTANTPRWPWLALAAVLLATTLARRAEPLATPFQDAPRRRWWMIAALFAARSWS